MSETFSGTIAELGQVIVAHPRCSLLIAGMLVTTESAEIAITNGAPFGEEATVRLRLRGFGGLEEIDIQARFDTPIECVIDRQS